MKLGNHWAVNYILQLSDIIPNSKDNKFRPDDFATREEVAVSIVRLKNKLQTLETIELQLIDVGEIDKDLLVEISQAIHSGIIVGYENNTFRPYNNITRSEISSMFYKALY